MRQKEIDDQLLREMVSLLSFTRNEEITFLQDPGQTITRHPCRVPDTNKQPTRLFSTISAARLGQDIYAETALAV